MRTRNALLPATVPWKQVEVNVPGGSAKEPLVLYFRDALECFKRFLANPLLRDHLDFTPRREYTNEGKTERLFNEIMTGDRAWTLQVFALTEINVYYELTNDLAII